ncbi:MAG: SpoIID/LytB domain-containing protein [Firmicutes bacterium]|nr:SpoIID/LytB domain-containing protein [Bacillota bacterium]
MTGKIALTAVIIIILCAFIPGPAVAGPPETIRVGLRYGTTAPSSVQVGSEGGIEFGYDAGGGSIGLYTYTGKRNVHIRKDSFFFDRNGLLIETGQGDTPSLGIAFGPYHSQVSETFTDRQQAEKVLQDIADKGVEGYLAYHSGWRVWVGRYKSTGEMEKQNGELWEKLNGAYDVYPIDPSGDRLQINDDSGKVLFMFEDGGTFLSSRPIDGSYINVDGKRFRGYVEFRRHNGGNITVVNTLPLQQYLYGVVPREVSPDWHMEVLKAQAVAARNFAAVNLNKHGDFGFDVCSGTDCQVYGGLDSESQSTSIAVDETARQMIYYKGSPITAFFHASSGGHTENSENVWSISLPYIKAVDDSFDAGSPHDSWQRVYTSGQINSILAEHGINIGSIKDIKVDSYTPTGRSLALTIQGSRGSTVLEKERSRAIFGYNDLKSTLFTVETDADLFVLGGVGQPVGKIGVAGATAVNSAGIKGLEEGPDILTVSSGRDYAPVSKYPTRFIFNGRGWGHGLGMSQWGAKGMAEAGYSYMEILQYYYKGCVVE